jgi:hypothetical protein
MGGRGRNTHDFTLGVPVRTDENGQSEGSAPAHVLSWWWRHPFAWLFRFSLHSQICSPRHVIWLWRPSRSTRFRAPISVCVCMCAVLVGPVSVSSRPRGSLPLMQQRALRPARARTQKVPFRTRTASAAGPTGQAPVTGKHQYTDRKLPNQHHHQQTPPPGLTSLVYHHTPLPGRLKPLSIPPRS